MSKKVLITGAEGFIGSHLTEHLIRLGYKVRAFVLYNSFNSAGWLEAAPEFLRKKIDLFFGDVRDSHGVKKAMKGCDAVLHLAALIGIPYSYHSPDTYVDTNIRGTLNVLQAARELSVKKIIHTSTSEVYGTARFVPITEDHPLSGQSPYAATKIGADQLALSFYSSFGTPVTLLRPFNTYGPRQSTRAVIPAIITQILLGAKNIKLGSVHPTRDFSFVGDTVTAFEKALAPGVPPGEVINIGSHFEISVKDTALLIAKILNKKITIQEDSSRKRPKNSEVERLWASNAKAKKLLKWTPAHGGRAGFEKGLEKTIRWFSIPKNLAKYPKDVYSV